MGGEFFDARPKPTHRCEPPEPIGISAVTGDGWRCDCGRAYVLTRESQHGETWRQWRRAPEFDTGVGEANPTREGDDG